MCVSLWPLIEANSVISRTFFLLAQTILSVSRDINRLLPSNIFLQTCRWFSSSV